MIENHQKDFDSVKNSFTQFHKELNKFLTKRQNAPKAISQDLIDELNKKLTELSETISKRFAVAIVRKEPNPIEITSCIASMKSAHHKLITAMRLMAETDLHETPQFIDANSRIKYNKSLNSQEARNKRITEILEECIVFCINHKGESWQDKVTNLQHQSARHH